ncbi:hypothetical protein FisN_UnNu004 [Fistulifera solaris]|uniref:HMG box domain-containing protein n=1 Tax=Fistulifera solaris TaxID=1519565 RepID=A0A1Z5J9G1_FISSO|nr:hypothetical protein FisN_UnNu004 [Fistulifera solaris]|eukprot:GAX10532.1 hypothetical protein FisN_UnNu004 [Fistulifera solaris]
MSLWNERKPQADSDRVKRRNGGPEHQGLPQTAYPYSLANQLPLGYTMNAPLPPYDELIHPYSSVTSYNVRDQLLTQLIAAQLTGSILYSQLFPLHPYFPIRNETVTFIHEHHNSGVFRMQPNQPSDLVSSDEPSQHSASFSALIPPVTIDSRQQIPAEESTQQTPSSSLLSKPKRPLSAYNVFFQEERARIVKERELQNSKDAPLDSSKQRYQPNGTGFEDLAKEISKRWKSIDKKRLDKCSQLAETDTVRYQKELAAYKEQREAKLSAMQQAQVASVSEEAWKRYIAEAEKQKPLRNRKRKRK